MKPSEVVKNIIAGYMPYAIGLVLLGVIALFFIAKIKQEARTRRAEKWLEAKEQAKKRHFNKKQKAPKKDTP